MQNVIIFFKQYFQLLAIAVMAVSLSSCEDDEEMKTLMSGSFEYAVHNGQTVASLPYAGTHSGDFSAMMMLEEQEEGGTLITVTLMNTLEGETYAIHAHDAADASSTPNGTPYNETPNGDVFVQMASGNGGTVSVSQMTDMTYEELTMSYEGFFVIHDPLQNISTTDISTYLVVGGFARTQTMPDLMSSSYMYAFNTGQLVADYAYSGSHSSDLSAMITVQELVNGNSRITVDLMNTINGEMYATHAHDMADPAETPNGTPYIEAPNGDVFVQMISGNGSTASAAQISSYSYADITTSYDAFFVVHDPLQTMTTLDPTTYVMLGVFARN